MKNITSFQKQVYAVCAKIPKGKVSTYGEIAKAIRKPESSRAVGNALNKNPYAPKVPCHRVVRSDTRIGGFASGARKKMNLLRKEGVKIKRGKVESFGETLFKF